MSLGGVSGSKGQSSSESEESLDQIIRSSGSSTEGLEIDDAAVDKIVQDLLSADGGLADIMGGEQSTGLFNSSVAALEAGDLTANIVGEIAKLRAKKVKTSEGMEETEAERNARGSGKSSSFGGEFGIGG